MDKSAIDTPSREIDLRNIPVHLRTALRRALEFEARAPAPTSAEEAEHAHSGETDHPFRWQTDHLFRRKPITRSDANRSPVGAKRRGTKS